MNVTVQRLEEPGPLQGLVMIVFMDVATPVAARTPLRTPKPHAHNAALDRKPAGSRRGAGRTRRDADLAGGTPVRQRGAAIHE